MEVLIVGAGEMGRWLGETLANQSESLLPADPADESLELIFHDRERTVAAETASAVGGAARVLDPDAEHTFDLVCIAVPISAADTAIETHAPRVESAMIDITGECATSVEAMAEHVPSAERASLHPLFAAENAPGNVPIVVDNDGQTIARLRETLEAAGNTLIETTPAEHDAAMETIQSAAHSAVLAYALAVESVPPGFETPVSATLDELTDQITGNDPHVYAEIQSTFDGADAVADAARRIADADPAGFEAIYQEAGNTPAGDHEGREEKSHD